MKVIVYHAEYGCDTGCCGHVVELEDGRHEFDFSHPYGEDPKQYAKDLIESSFPEEHTLDLDWDNCVIVDED
jgi:hypothetical protein